MPTYVYRCPACDHVFELFQPKISDRPRTKKCPACGGRARREISGGAGFLFKGDGFYATDYRSQEYRKKAEADKGEKPAGGSEKKEKSGEGSPDRGSRGDSGA